MNLYELKTIIDDYYETSLEEGVNPRSVKINVGLQPTYPLRGRLENICSQFNESGGLEKLWFATSNGIDYNCPREIWDMEQITIDK